MCNKDNAVIPKMVQKPSAGGDNVTAVTDNVTAVTPPVAGASAGAAATSVAKLGNPDGIRGFTASQGHQAGAHEGARHNDNGVITDDNRMITDDNGTITDDNGVITDDNNMITRENNEIAADNLPPAAQRRGGTEDRLLPRHPVKQSAAVSRLRIKRLTEAEIESCFYELMAEGHNPTARKIRERLQRGSMTTIQVVVSRLNQQLLLQKVEHITNPPRVGERTRQLAARLIEIATQEVQQEADRQIAELKELLICRHQKDAESASQLSQNLTEQTGKVRVLTQQVEELQAQLAKERQRNEQLLNQVNELTARDQLKQQKFQTYKSVSNLLDLLSQSPANSDFANLMKQLLPSDR